MNLDSLFFTMKLWPGCLFHLLYTVGNIDVSDYFFSFIAQSIFALIIYVFLMSIKKKKIPLNFLLNFYYLLKISKGVSLQRLLVKVTTKYINEICNYNTLQYNNFIAEIYTKLKLLYWSNVKIFHNFKAKELSFDIVANIIDLT